MTVFSTYEIVAPPQSAFAAAVGGPSPVVLLGLLRRAVMQRQRIRAIAVAARRLEQTQAAAAAESIRIIGERDAFGLNSPDVGAWIEAMLTLLTPDVRPDVLGNIARSIEAASPTETITRLIPLSDAIRDGIDADAAIRSTEAPSRIDTTSLSARVELPSVECHSRLTPQEAERVTPAFLSAQELITTIMPWLNTDRATFVPRIVPVPMQNARLLSWTNSALLGTVFITVHDDPGLVAEQLVHEISHSRLFLIQMIDELLHEAYPNESWTKACYYSPWRRDPRPLNGIVHGVFVFDAVAELWTGILHLNGISSSTKAAARRRLGQVIGQLVQAHDTLRTHARFTAAGEAVIARLRHRLENSYVPFFESERLGEERALDLDAMETTMAALTVKNQLDRHRAEWMRNHVVTAA